MNHGGKMSFRSQLSNDEWYTLQCAPVWVFALVAGIDGTIDKKEMKSFAESIAEMAHRHVGLPKEIFQSIVADINQVMRCESNGEAALKGLVAVNHVLKKVNQTDATLYKQSLIVLGNKVAESSGPLFQDNRSDKETQVLAVIYKILELD
jgi:hypothetical protein